MTRVQLKSYIVQKAEKRYSLGFILLKMLKEDLHGIYFIPKFAFCIYSIEKARKRQVSQLVLLKMMK